MTEISNEPFADLPAPISAALEARGFEDLTPVQRAVVDAASAGRDLRISSQTGSGKTVAIGLALAEHFLVHEEAGPSKTVEATPATGGAAEAEVGAKGVAIGPRELVKSSTDDRSADATAATGPVAETKKPAKRNKPAKQNKAPKPPRGPRGAAPRALIIVPTRELAAQVRGELDWLYAKIRGVRVAVVTGGTSVEGERRMLARGAEIVVGTPGRLIDHMTNAALDPSQIEHVVLDEADQMLDMGFREELEEIVDRLPEARASHLVSATFPRGVIALADRYQTNPLVIEGTRLGVANADIQHIAYAIRRHETYPALVNVLLMGEGERFLLFVNRRVDATELAEKLASDGFGAAPFSGELPQAQRTRTLNAFRNGTLPILVSTEVAARGIDVPGISTVIHVDPPRTADAYTHRSGRTGRAGQSGRSVLFVTPPDLGRVRRVLHHARVEISWQPIPGPEKVQKAMRKRARRELHARLAASSPTEAQSMYAKNLLEDRDPIQVVATLLELAAPTLATEPLEVTGFDPERAGGRNARHDRFDGRGGREDRGHGRARDRDRSGPGRPPRVPRNASEAAGGTDFVRFFVSWGEESGATTGRLLSQICRRGGIESHQVGPIEIAARVSFVGVASDVAERFEKMASKRDERDPGIAIKRAHDRPGGSSRGPAAGPRSERSRHPSGPRRSGFDRNKPERTGQDRDKHDRDKKGPRGFEPRGRAGQGEKRPGGRRPFERGRRDA